MDGSLYDLYEKDFYAWTQKQAALLRAGKLSEIDIAHLAEEIDSIGRSEKRELISRLTLLLLHLLKWDYQPERRGACWEGTIAVQRDNIADLLTDNPSLRAGLDLALGVAYRKAVLMAVAETGLARGRFPEVCPWGLREVLG
ncbi:hypothetical protein CHU95_07430 [Niveispirillum lacus]|uniref:DUF29 domain-containing protein n=1 Tax=Niveispirillum lacus TaxID=1981099 RepID=A0A255Z4H4_9PROT|nr:DUF29 domain-containing protein [Niveispirillum lacus]OYQ35550.1 hypothetical protein CHU95_07430 [Niveispirillum lacus]